MVSNYETGWIYHLIMLCHLLFSYFQELLPCGRMKPVDAVVATLSSLPDEVVDTIRTVLPSEDSVSERRKLKFLEMQEELIKEEEKKKEKEEKAAQKKEEKANLTEQEAAEEDLALKEMTEPTAREEEELIEAKQHDQQQLCNISQALAVLASASSVSKERQEFLSLVNKEIKLYNSMLEREDTEGAEEARKAYMAAREESDDTTDVASEEKVSSALIDKVDAMLQELEKEIDDVDAQIGNLWQLLDRLPTNWKGQEEGAIIKPPAHQEVECLPGGFPFIPRSRYVHLVTELILQANEDSGDDVALEAWDSGWRSVNMQNLAQAGDAWKEQEAAVLVL